MKYLLVTYIHLYIDLEAVRNIDQAWLETFLAHPAVAEFAKYGWLAYKRYCSKIFN